MPRLRIKVDATRMALLNTWYCCSLLTGSFVAAIYAMAVYVVAFSIQVWWIIESDGLPPPAYVLCAGYFITFLGSMALTASLAMRRLRYLLGWIFMMILFYFPEAGMVLFVSLYYWGPDSNYGMTELIFWICRAILNVLAVVGIQSQYASWKEEDNILRRLHDLTAVATIPESEMANGHHKANGSLGYQNAGFVGSTPIINGDSVMSSGDKRGSLKRSSSAASYLVSPHQHPQLSCMSLSVMGGSLPVNPSLELTARMAPLNALQMAALHDTQGCVNNTSSSSQFDASQFVSMHHHNMVHHNHSELGIAGMGLPSHGEIGNGGGYGDAGFKRHSLLLHVDDLDYWSRPPPSRPVSLGYVNQVTLVDYGTQSLDRRRFLKNGGGPRRAVSVDFLHFRPGSDVTLQRLKHQPFCYLNRGSRSSLGEESDSRYRDVAL